LFASRKTSNESSNVRSKIAIKKGKKNDIFEFNRQMLSVSSQRLFVIPAILEKKGLDGLM
jgi:hypothetical protein